MSDKLVGTCGYNIRVQPALAHWRRGLMSEALAAILEFGFVRMNLNRIEALTFTTEYRFDTPARQTRLQNRRPAG